MRENRFLGDDTSGIYLHCYNTVCAGTTQNKRWMRENDKCGNNGSRFYCILFLGGGGEGCIIA